MGLCMTTNWNVVVEEKTKKFIRRLEIIDNRLCDATGNPMIWTCDEKFGIVESKNSS